MMTRLASFVCLTLLATSSACAGSAGESDAAAKPKPEAAGTEAKPEAQAEDVATPEGALAATPFEGEDGLYGYKSESGEVVIEAKFPIAGEFEDQVAGVATDEGWVFIDRHGKQLARAFVFDNGPDEFVDGRARIVEGEGDALRYGFLASSGEITVAPTWSWVMPYADGLAPVCEGCVREQDGEHFTMKGGKWGYVDLSGKLVVEAKYSVAGPFADGRASVELDGKALTIGPDGSVLND